jgi:predicted metal-dependent hydrolase
MPTRELVSRDLHRVELDGAELDYVLVRRRGRRGVGLKVDATGLTVSAPLSVPLGAIEGYLRDNARWIRRKVAEWGARRAPPAQWHDGALLPYLGRTIALRRQAGARSHAELAGDELNVTSREDGDEAVRRTVVAWYKRLALPHFAERAFVLARAGGLPMPRVFLSSAAARWGSCNTKREIRLAWRLLKAPPALIDYVVCHELAHLRHMNHSPAFWAEVGRLCPDHRRLRGELEAADPLYRTF